MRLICVVLCFVLRVYASLAIISDPEVVELCILQCSQQNRTESPYVLECESDCDKQCEIGCQLWRKALNTSCMSACNATNTLSDKELHCVMGCNKAVTIYTSELRADIGTPPPPALVADSLTANSLRLEWNYKKPDIPGLKYLVLWRYEEYASAWQFYKNQSLGPGENDTIFFVDNLQPYTKYRFRVAIILFQPNEHVVSAQSVVIMTLPAGVPVSAPSSVRAVPVDCSRISVSWEPGPFPNGPILSYVVKITDNGTSSYSALKEIPAEKNFYMFTSLKPGKKYTVSISMSNGVGTGPAARTIVRMPRESAIKDTQGPVLIIGTEHEIVEQGVDIADEPVTLYNTDNFVKIKGVAIYVKSNELFISDSMRYVYRMPLSKRANSEKTAILSPAQIPFRPLDLSIDWLNEQIYILGETNYQRKIWSVSRCGLDGRDLTVAVAGLTVKPHHIEVDPYNGYLFWIIHDSNKSGLYRLDLSDISNGIKHEIKPELIFSEPNLGAFIVDHSNFLLLVSNQNNRTVNSVSLDGKEVNNVRPKIINSLIEKVLSIATANKQFYWTDGKQVFFEEYHENDETYFQNSYSALSKESYLKVIINLPSSQPIPVPINPPTSTQAIFGSDRAKTSWKLPHLLGGQGKGAWQNWSYEISVKDVEADRVETYRNINSTSHTIGSLQEDTEYVFKVAAYTDSGRGPWSSEFKGRSLKISRDGTQPVVLWSAAEGLLKSDATGENVETLIHSSSMKDYYFTDSAWHEDQVYLVSNDSKVFWYNFTTHRHGQIPNLDSVGSISIDWIGKKMYWSNPKQQWIVRGSLRGTDQETLPISTIAKELIVHPVYAYLYWSTMYEVFCARLNGADLITYHKEALFAGKQIMGLTLDTNHNFVYWIVRGSEGSNLFRAPMAGTKAFGAAVDEQVTSLQRPDMQGPLCYFNNRLLWLQDDRNAVISNMEGGNLAVVNGKSLSGLNMVYIIDSTFNTFDDDSPMDKNNISVIPAMVDQNSFKVTGSWESFNITWKPVQNVNFGVVFYEIKIECGDISDQPVNTTVPTIKYWRTLPPFSEINVLVRAFTYWGSSAKTRLILHTPSSTPSEPENLRTYVTYTREYDRVVDVSATFRWDKPSNANGVIERYRISCWYEEEYERVDLRRDVFITADVREYVLKDLSQREIYYFEVQAYTNSAGPSATTQANTSVESPLPMLVMSSSDSVFVRDTDSNENKPLLHGISAPIAIAYAMKENKLFWLNDVKELFMYNSETKGKSKIFEISGEPSGLTLDWLERSIYYAETNPDGGSSVHKLDLNHVEKGVVRSVPVYKSTTAVYNLEVSPFTKKLYWIEEGPHNEYHLVSSNTDGSEKQPFIVPREPDEDSAPCTCPLYPYLEKAFALDHSGADRPQLVFTDYHRIVSADKTGCHCETVAQDYQVSPVRTLASDFRSLYWTDGNGSLYTLKRSEPTVDRQRVDARDALIFGAHVQPYPPPKCLTPAHDGRTAVTLLGKTANSLVLKMPEVRVAPECAGMSMAAVQYTVFYAPFDEEEDDGSPQCDGRCEQLVSFDDTMEIGRLKPYSKYVFFVGLSNHYSGLEGGNIASGPGVIYQTDVGVPSKPQNVTVTVLNPTLVQVTWLPPEEFNGDVVYYKIHWQTEGAISGITQKGEQIVADNDVSAGSGRFSAHLKKLTPSQTYSAWVRAYSQTNETWNDSASVKFSTFPEPDNLTVASYSAYRLLLEWNVSHHVDSFEVQYSLLTTNDWKYIPKEEGERDNDTVAFVTDDLRPKTQYKFRFMLRYPKYDEAYIWPKDPRFIFETLGDRPTPPGKPEIRFISGNESKVWWEPSKDNGGPVLLYKLEGMKVKNYHRERRSTNRTAWSYNSPSVDIQDFEWEQLYNGTDTYWKITDLTDEYRYTFRAFALNDYGWSNSSEYTEFDPTTAALMAEKNDPLILILVAICVPVAILLTLLVCCACCKWNCGKSKKAQQVVAQIRGPDVELATLRELPRRSNFIHNTNILYVSAQPTPEEITLLPHIRRDQITLMKFLGSGAFGEVFEGKAKGLTNNGSDTKVAVKTLRKGASDQEKTEFLQEAQLMSHFKHEHILQLLGVCLDNDPHFIIMELMGGGDLLTYLRSSRKPGSSTPALTLVELLKMCVDVATGCRYLEEMHYVHRDLACRNCLVSSTDPETRIVKIGDFGLARDIYKNDYYRKEGEGLLPVRWMAPESLVDGVFTSQSDVWAFGVLLWEIMTLGQQPYPARNNLEVLHYVRRGGRLGKPTDCPETLHELMLVCWSYEQERRPTFKYCLETLWSLHQTVSCNPVTSAHEGQYISTVPDHFDGVANQVYFQDLNHNNNSGSSWKSCSGDSSRERTPFLQPEPASQPQPDGPTEIPKYLELVYDSDCPVENDGYEVPRTDLDLAQDARTAPTTTNDSSEKENLTKNFDRVIKDLTSIENLLKDGGLTYSNETALLMNNGSLKLNT